MCFPSKPQIWLNIVALFFVFVSSPFQFCIKAGSSRPLPWQFFSNRAARAPPLPRTEPISMPCSEKKKKLIEKRLTCFKACWELGARREPKVLKPRQYQFAIKRQYTCPHAQPTSTCCDSEDFFFFFSVNEPFMLFCHCSILQKSPGYRTGILSLI